MCELLGADFNIDIRARFSFRGLMNHSGVNPHGWGIAFYPDGSRAAQVIKEPLRAVDSEMAEFLKRYEGIYSSIYISHIRHATSAKCYENTHPFSRELNGREYVFAHNGSLRGAYRDELEIGRFKPLGTTDSEFAFCHIMNFVENNISEPGLGTSKEFYLKLESVMRKINQYGNFNCLMSNGEYLYCYHDMNGYKGLDYTRRKAPFGGVRLLDEDIEVDLDVEKSAREKGYIIATRPLTDENWTSFMPGKLYVFKDGEMIFNDQGLSEEEAEDFEEKFMLALRCIRNAPKSVKIGKIAEATSYNQENIRLLIDYMVDKGYIQKHTKDAFDKYDPKTRYFTVEQRRDEIDRMIGNK